MYFLGPQMAPDAVPSDRAPGEPVATPERYFVPMRPAVLVSWTVPRLIAAFGNFLMTALRLLLAEPAPAGAQTSARKDSGV